MDETKYLKCLCSQCGAPIEFPAEGAGMTIACPHCGAQTTLVVPHVALAVTPRSPETRSPPAKPGPSESLPVSPDQRNSGRKWYIVSAVVLLVVVAGAGGLLMQSRTGNIAPAASTNATPNGGEPAAPRLAPRPRSLDDLTAGAISLEKGRGGSLVYAVGVMKNNSDHQRFGVTVELDIFDNLGSKVGTATDYRAVIEPRQEWRFRALVLNAKAAKARLAKVRESE